MLAAKRMEDMTEQTRIREEADALARRRSMEVRDTRAELDALRDDEERLREVAAARLQVLEDGLRGVQQTLQSMKETFDKKVELFVTRHDTELQDAERKLEELEARVTDDLGKDMQLVKKGVDALNGKLKEGFSDKMARTEDAAERAERAMYDVFAGLNETWTLQMSVPDKRDFIMRGGVLVPKPLPRRAKSPPPSGKKPLTKKEVLSPGAASGNPASWIRSGEQSLGRTWNPHPSGLYPTYPDEPDPSLPGRVAGVLNRSKTAPNGRPMTAMSYEPSPGDIARAELGIPKPGRRPATRG